MKFIILFAANTLAMVVPSSYYESNSDLKNISKEFNNFEVDENEESKIFSSFKTDQDELNKLLNQIKTIDHSEQSNIMEKSKIPTEQVENMEKAMKYCFNIEGKPKEQKACFSKIAQLFKLFYSKWRGSGGSKRTHQRSSADYLLDSQNFE